MIDEVFFLNKHFTELNPRGVGYEKCVARHSCGPEKRDHYIMQFVISGHGLLRFNHKTYIVHENQVFLIPPETLYYYQADKDDPWEYVWLNFDGNYSENLKALPSPVINMEYSYFKDLLLCKNYPNMESEYLVGRLYIIMAEMLKKSSTGNHVTIVKDYITTHYMQSISIQHIADVIGLNREYLSRIFKKSTGQSMQDFLMDIRMLKAMNLLKNHNYNISTIALLCGYNDIYVFSKSFKKYFGNPPKFYLPPKIDSMQDL